MSRNSELSRIPDYYTARAIEERRLAMASSDARARAIHLELAEKYDGLAHGRGESANSADDQQQSA